MLYRHVRDKISIEFHSTMPAFVSFADLPEFHGFATVRNVSQALSCVIYIIETGDLKFASGDYISPVGRQKAT